MKLFQFARKVAGIKNHTSSMISFAWATFGIVNSLETHKTMALSNLLDFHAAEFSIFVFAFKSLFAVGSL